MDTNVEVKTAYVNALQTMSQLNDFLKTRGVKNKDGTQAEFKEIAASPFWLFLLAHGSIQTEWQEKLRESTKSLDPASCSDSVLLNLALISGVQRKAGVSARIYLEFENPTLSDVTISATVKITDGSINSVWYLPDSVTVPAMDEGTGIAGKVQAFAFADTFGNRNVPKGTSCKIQGVEDVSCTTISKAVGGQKLESMNSLRNRMIVSQDRNDPIISAQEAMENNIGIEKVTIYFNELTDTAKTIRGVSVEPRHALVVVLGSDIEGNLPSCFYQYLNVPTQETEDCITEYYNRGENPLAFYFMQAKTQTVWVKVSVKADRLGKTYTENILSLITERSGTFKIGENVSSAQISSWLYGNVTSTIISVFVGMSENENSEQSNLDVDAVAVFDKDCIIISAEE